MNTNQGRSSTSFNPNFENPLRNCVLCFYKCGFGCRTIESKTGINRSLVSRWARKSELPYSKCKPYKTKSPRGRKSKSKLEYYASRINELIMEEYKAHGRAAGKPDRLWADCKLVQRWQEKRKRETDPKHRAVFYARKTVRKYLRLRRIPKDFSITKAIGCSPEQLRDWLASKFKTGMSWANHGLWHIDHIVPLASANRPEDVMPLCHYTNLQPLWALDNMRKGDKTLCQALLVI